MGSHAFLSYQTADKLVAGQVRRVLADVGIDCFLAHEDIAVSEEWRLKILEEIGKADIFICLLSKDYYNSPWCSQESGIAAFRQDMTIIPLSLDGTIPQGFISSFQSVKVDPERVTLHDLIPGFVKHDFARGVEILTDLVGRSGSFRGAEANFEAILPYIPRMTDEQIKLLLERSADNGEIHHANLCARRYLPPLLKSHGHLLSKKIRMVLAEACAQYAKP